MKPWIIAIAVILLLLLTTACGGSATPAVETPAPTQPAVETPTPTTPPPSPATTPTEEPPAPTPPAPIPEPEPVGFSGTGDDVSAKFMLEEGITIISMTHSGESNFAVELLNDAGETAELLVNEIGAFEGSKAIGVRQDSFMGAKPGTHLLNITADGSWTIKVEQPRPTTAQALPLNLTGKGCSVTPFFTLEAGTVVFEMTHDGQSNFAISLLAADGKVAELLVNEIGAYQGKKAVGIKAGSLFGAQPGVHLLNIEADGNWTVAIAP